MLIIYDFIQLFLFISHSTGLCYVIYQMQSIPKRGFNISKFYDSLKIDSDMFRPFKIIDDTINVQDQGIYIYIYIFFSNFVDSKCMFVFISFHHQVFFCRKWLQGYMLGCSSDDVILLTLVTQPAFACSNSTIETPNLFKINNTDIYEQLLLKPIKAYLGPCLFAKTVID